MANPQPTKRQHPDPGTSYHDPVPLSNNDFDFDTTPEKEGLNKSAEVSALLLFLGTLTMALRGVQLTPGTDNSEFALDPNGDLYDDLVEGDVMEELVSPDNPSKKKQSRVSVSFIYFSMK